MMFLLKRPLWILMCLITYISLRELHCLSIPTTTTTAITSTETITETSTDTITDRSTETSTNSSTDAKVREDLNRGGAITYTETNKSDGPVHDQYKQSYAITTTETLTATNRNTNASNFLYDHSKQMFQHELPKITRDFKAARIYESFRAAGSSGRNSNEIFNIRTKRFKETTKSSVLLTSNDNHNIVDNYTHGDGDGIGIGIGDGDDNEDVNIVDYETFGNETFVVNTTLYETINHKDMPSYTTTTTSNQIPEQINTTKATTTTTTTASPPLGVRKRTASSDMLSRNISIILENLLKSYEQSQLPTHGQGIPTVVRTNILIRSMGPVSELDMDYSMDCYFRQYWRDKRLSFRGPIKSLSLSIKMLDKIWRPDTYFYNGKHSHIHTITVPNKLLRLDQDGGILYSMRLTIKATCPMELKNFPMDRQSCPLIFGSYGYTSRQLVYEWKDQLDAVSFVPGMTLNQFDLISMMHRNFTFTRREGDFSVLHVAFNLKRHTGYFLIQVYVPCILIVVLSWVSFWIHREATSDRVGLCVTAVLTLSTISLDSRTDLPKVKYATALDWFLLMSFLYCIATLLEFAGVHYFTKVGSGEIPRIDDEWEDISAADVDIGDGGVRAGGGNAGRAVGSGGGNARVASTSGVSNIIEANEEYEDEEDDDNEDDDDEDDDDDDDDDNEFDEIDKEVNYRCSSLKHSNESICELPQALAGSFRKRNAMICPIYNDPTHIFHAPSSSHASTMERTTQTEPPTISKAYQMWLCLKGDVKFRKQRERDAAAEKGGSRYVNSVSLIDRVARIAFPMSFALFNLLYWLAYGMYKKEFSWSTVKG